MDEQTALNQRGKDLLFQTLELFRKEIKKDFSDWKDADDWLFSNLDISKSELAEIYKDKNVMVYGHACI